MSKYRLSSSNLLEMAVATEETAKEFYTNFAQKFPNFIYHFSALAKDEERHARIYSELLNRKTGSIQNLDNEYVTILEGMFTGLFGSLRDGASRAKKVTTMELAIEASIQLEKDTLLFYISMNRIFENVGEQEIDKIIKEEQYHLQRVKGLQP